MTNAEEYEGAFARGVRLHREQRGESQQWLADKMRAEGHEWHQSTVYKVESGKRKVMVEEAASIADIFQVPISDLLASSDSSGALAVRRVNEAADALVDSLLQMDELAVKSHQQRLALSVACAIHDEQDPRWGMRIGGKPIPGGVEETATQHYRKLLDFQLADEYALKLRDAWDAVGPLMYEHGMVNVLAPFAPTADGLADG